MQTRIVIGLSRTSISTTELLRIIVEEIVGV